MTWNTRYLFFLLLLLTLSCQKEQAKINQLTATTKEQPKSTDTVTTDTIIKGIENPLLSKLTLLTPTKTYVDEYTYDTQDFLFKNYPVSLRSEIAGKIIKFQYGLDLAFRVTLNTVDEYDINTNKLTNTYQYTGYYTLEPGLPPYEKDVTMMDENKRVLKTFSYYKQEVDSLAKIITNGSDSTRIRYDERKNMIVFSPVKDGSRNIVYTYDNKHNPLSLLGAENEHLSFSIYATPQTFVNNPLTITFNGVTTNYHYQYNQYGYPVTATISNNTSLKYEYIAKK